MPASESFFSLLNTAIEALNLAKEISSPTPAKAVFGTASALLVMIRDSMINRQDYVELGLSCARVCKVLSRGLNQGRIDELSEPVLEAIGELTTTVAAIQEKIDKKRGRNRFSRIFHSGSDKDAIAGWGRDLDRILLIFNTEFSINNHVLLLDVRRGQGGADAQHQSIQASISLGELPPPRPRACFGRDGLIEKIVGLANTLSPIALIGAGGIGKTSTALAALHHDRIKQRFGDNRRFICCDKFPASQANFLNQLSRVIGAGTENPEDLASLRPLLSSKEMFIVLDNAESILDPQGTDAREIYTMVRELSQFSNICLCITSRISNIPPHCKRLEIPTLPMESACDIFYSIYGDGDRSKVIDGLLQRLDFHALSITLLATTASDNMWSLDRVAKEWDEQRGRVLRTDYNESLATTIELSLTSPTFRTLGPNARDLLGVIAFFPRGIDEENLDWFFPTIPDRKNIFDKFCTLSLTYRNDGFITMLAPIQDYLCPRDPRSSSFLCATKDHYLTRLSVDLDPDEPGFSEAQWIKSEDANVEHLLHVFTSNDMNAFDVWDACYHFMDHLYWQKPRKTVLRSKIEALPDDHSSKAKCLFYLALLVGVVGNHADKKRLLMRTLALGRAQEDDFRVAETLQSLSDVNRSLGLYSEGIPQAKEAFKMFKELGNTKEQAICLDHLAWLLVDDNQLDAAEDTVLRKIKLLPEKGQEFQVCLSHRLLGQIYCSKGEKEKSIHHYDTALAIASLFNWQGELFWIHWEMARLFRDQCEFNDATAHTEQAKLQTADNTYYLGRGMEMQARIWYQQHRLEDARPEALGALEIYERLGAVKDGERCRGLLQRVEKAMETRLSGKTNSNSSAR